MLLAVFGCNIMLNLVKVNHRSMCWIRSVTLQERVELLRYVVILHLIVFIQTLYTSQKFAITIAVSAKKFDDDPLMPPAIKANCEWLKAISSMIFSLVPLRHHLRNAAFLRFGHLSPPVK
jgi:hypothetical protein